MNLSENFYFSRPLHSQLLKLHLSFSCENETSQLDFVYVSFLFGALHCISSGVSSHVGPYHHVVLSSYALHGVVKVDRLQKREEVE